MNFMLFQQTILYPRYDMNGQWHQIKKPAQHVFRWTSKKSSKKVPRTDQKNIKVQKTCPKTHWLKSTKTAEVTILYNSSSPSSPSCGLCIGEPLRGLVAALLRNSGAPGWIATAGAQAPLTEVPQQAVRKPLSSIELTTNDKEHMDTYIYIHK